MKSRVAFDLFVEKANLFWIDDCEQGIGDISSGFGQADNIGGLVVGIGELLLNLGYDIHA